MGPVEAIRTCFGKFADFRGRASRSEYWWFVAFLLLGNMILNWVDRAIFGDGPAILTTETDEGGMGLLSSVFWIATVVRSFSAGWRRLHDVGKSGLYLLYPFFVFATVMLISSAVAGTPEAAAATIGSLQPAALRLAILALFFFYLCSPLIVLWWLTQRSEREDNAYGPRPTRVTT